MVSVVLLSSFGSTSGLSFNCFQLVLFNLRTNQLNLWSDGQLQWSHPPQYIF